MRYARSLRRGTVRDWLALLRRSIWGHRVTVVPSLAEPRDQLTRAVVEGDPFAVVLLDYDLDDGKGDALMPDLVKIMPRPRVVAVSSHERGNAALLRAGADAVCPKMRLHTVATFS